MTGKERKPASGPARGGQAAKKKGAAWIPTAVEPRGAAPLRLGEVLVGTQQYLARQSGAPMTQDEWRTIVGPKIASRTRLGRLHRGSLTIKVASSSWSNELSFLRPQILARLAKSGQDVTRLRFVVDQELSATPRRRSGKTVPPIVARPLPEGLAERLEQIEDPNLRAAVAEAVRVSLGRTSGPDSR